MVALLFDLFEIDILPDRLFGWTSFFFRVPGLVGTRSALHIPELPSYMVRGPDDG